MCDILNLIEQIENIPHCRVLPPDGVPNIISNNHKLPSDVELFYKTCGGIVLYDDMDYSTTILKPNDVLPANPVILGEAYDDDITSDWYVIGSDNSNEYLTIDFNKDRLGLCYDSFSDSHGLVGDSQIIAESFTDLIKRLIENKGNYWYWLQADFEYIGDAYDNV